MVTATDDALAAIVALTEAHGRLMFFQSGGGRDGPPICLREGELPTGHADLLLGTVGGAPFYVDADQYEAWGRPELVLDLAPGPPPGFSLGHADTHFVTRARAAPG
jgi:uncharacterized protein (DUF779 family)